MTESELAFDAFKEVQDLKSQISGTANLIAELATEISDNRGNEDLSNEEETLKTLMQESIALDCDVSAFLSAANKLRCTSGFEQDTDIWANFSEVLEKEQSRRTPSHNNMYAELCRTLERETVQAENDDEDIAVETVINEFKDPITQQPIQDPVRNRVCKHIYDKTTIAEYIRTTRRPRCPYVGCSVRDLLNMDNMIHDGLTARIIRQRQQD